MGSKPAKGRRGLTYCPAVEGDPDVRVAAFVDFARTRTTLLGADLAFDADVWDVTARIPGRPSKPSRPHVSSLAFGQARLRGGAPGTMRSPARDFAKAYTRLTLRVGFHGLWQRLNVVRLVDEALEECGLTSMADVTPAILDAALRAAAERYAGSTLGQVRAQLQLLAKFLGEHGMTHSPTGEWLATGQAPKAVAGSSGLPFEANQATRLPTAEFVAALGRSFRLARGKRDVIVSSVGALLSSAPERIGEVLNIVEDCEVERKRDGRIYLALRWSGSKGIGMHLKWIPTAMAPVVRSALTRLRDATAQARAMKAWYDRHPEELYLPEHLLHLRGRQLLSQEEAGTLIGITPGRALHEYAIRYALGLVEQSRRFPGPGARLSFGVVERHILAQLAESMRIAGGVGARPLMLVEWRSFAWPGATGCPCMFESVRYHTIRIALRSCPQHPSMFQRLGLDPDGAISGRTHSLRHYLCTMAEAGGLSPEDICEFRGGANPYHNRAYNHVPTAVTRLALEGLAASICRAAATNP